ncbi:MAG: hypothetical protein WBL35_13280 [Ornithinibacter sp.]
MRNATMTPDAMPVLSAGRHRNPRKGACFMEMASFLAGEKWSDHPSCTHPLLAGLARLVNDALPDSERSRIAPLIPDVVGLTGDSIDVDLAITVRAAAAALPVASAERQNVLAASLTTCERLMDEEAGSHDELRRMIAQASATAPLATRWARAHERRDRLDEATFRRRTGPTIVRYAVHGLETACTGDRNDRLVALLADAIADVSARCPDVTGRREATGAGRNVVAVPEASDAMTSRRGH